MWIRFQSHEMNIFLWHIVKFVNTWLVIVMLIELLLRNLLMLGKRLIEKINTNVAWLPKLI